MIDGRYRRITLVLSFFSPRITTLDHEVSSRFLRRDFSLLIGALPLICLTVLSRAKTATMRGFVSRLESSFACTKRFSWPAWR